MDRDADRLCAVLAPAAALAVLLAWGCDDPAKALVIDGARLLDDAQRRLIERHHAYLREDHDVDYRVVTVADGGDVNRFAAEEFARLRIGERGAGGRGLLLVIDPVQDRVRLEVGHALEGIFPDAFVAYVEQRQMVPFFAQRRVADGILAATELIVTRAQRAAARGAGEDEIWMAGSGGGGATASARLGRGAEPVAARRPGNYPPGESPQETLQAYLAAMSARDASPALPLYTPETRRMLAEWVVTPAQMDNVAKVYRRCPSQSLRMSDDGQHAVIRYPAAERQCAPWFFARISGRWHLDLVTMQQVIRFGRSNAWRLDRRASHPYAFAFADWSFDSHGFPRP